MEKEEEEVGKVGKGKEETDQIQHIKKMYMQLHIRYIRQVNRKNCIYLKTNNICFEIQSPKKHTRLTPKVWS